MKSILTKTLLAAVAALLSISAASAGASSSSVTVTDADTTVSRSHDKVEGPFPKDNSRD